jgi:transcriptional regulator with XRE-family HTH domain
MANAQLSIADLRAELALSQSEFAEAVGLSSKGHVSQIERGEASCSVPVALKIEELSGGRVPADQLNDDVALVRATPVPAVS